MKYPIGTETVGNFYVTTPQPLDNKYLFEDATDLADVSGNDPLSYYEGMIVQDCDTGQKYRWVESTVGLIPGGYTYGVYEYEGVVYTGRTFNFVSLGNPSIVVALGATFPPTYNYPQGTTAIRQYTSGPDTLTGVYVKQDNVAPGTWTEVMTFSLGVVDDAYIEAIVIAMFAGSGIADTIARSDHDHTGTYSPVGHDHDADYMPIARGGMLYTENLDNTDDLDDYINFGVFPVPSGASLPDHFPLTPDYVGLGAYNGNASFVVEVYETQCAGISGKPIIQVIRTHQGPQCYRYYYTNTASWVSWTRFEATDAEMLDDTNVNKFVTPSSLKNHEAWITVTTPALDHDWQGTFSYRRLTTGQIEVKAELDGNTGPASADHFIDLIAPYVPASDVYITGIYVDDADSTMYGAVLFIDSVTGKVKAYSDIGAGPTYNNGTFIFNGTYTID